jgi:hypothetical protein
MTYPFSHQIKAEFVLTGAEVKEALQVEGIQINLLVPP